MRNKIINGAMVIDQRNAGASVSINNTFAYTTDRWIGDARGAAGNGVISFQQSSTAPAGFSNSLSATLTTPRTSAASGDVFAIYQKVEGFNIADLAWGTSSAVTVTVSFWVRSSITGTYSGAIENSAQNRSYPFTFTISSANTFEYKTITITGDTSGTWLTTNGVGLWLMINLGCGSTYLGTAGAWASAAYLGATGSTNWATGAASSTFYITGVQLERGTIATPFEYRNYQQELAMCMRYYEKTYNQDEIPNKVNPNTANALVGVATSTTNIATNWRFQVNKRTQPTLAFYSWNGTGSGKWANLSNTDFTVSTPWGTGQSGFARLDSTGLTAGAFYWGYATADAEL
jgi:hypothetical protein